jgi:hypothetical protein
MCVWWSANCVVVDMEVFSWVRFLCRGILSYCCNCEVGYCLLLCVWGVAGLNAGK